MFLIRIKIYITVEGEKVRGVSKGSIQFFAQERQKCRCAFSPVDAIKFGPRGAASVYLDLALRKMDYICAGAARNNASSASAER
jgi:hypothetical protein